MENFEYVGNELEVFALASNWKRYFSALLRPYVHGRVLEVGAGIGETARALWNDDCSQWVCLEPDVRLAQRLQGVVLGSGSPPEIVVGDMLAIPASPAFDTIVYVDVLEHIREDTAELRSAAKRLAPGGRLVVLSPAFQSLYSPFDRAIGHERRYTRSTLSAVFPKELNRLSVFYADALGAALSFANSLVLKQSMPTRRQIVFWDRVIVPISRVLDPLVLRGFGRSVIAIYSKPRETRS